MGDKGTFVALPSAPQTFRAASRAILLSSGNRPPAPTLLRAEIFTHSTAYGELDLNNNSAQENVTTFSPKPAVLISRLISLSRSTTTFLIRSSSI